MNIYKQAIEKWGERSQLEMAQEESTELALACRRYIRKPSDETFQDLISEVADVEIMIEQLKIMLPINGMVDIEKKRKLGRLERRIKGDDYEAK